MTGVLCVWISNIALMLQVAAGTELGQNQSENSAALASAPALTVIDEAGKGHTLAPAEFSRLPRQSAKVTTHDADAEFSGPSLVDVLKMCGIAFGKELRGRRTPTAAILEATDGYRVVVALLEIDPGTNDKVALVADRRDGSPLSETEGPYRLILPGEKREVRWIRNLRTIRIINLQDIPLDGPRPNRADDGQK